MEKIITTTLLMLSIGAQLMGQVIRFEENVVSWEEILQKSVSLNKPIFVDVYTEWCGPCKWMDQNVFNQEEVAAFMNGHFLSVKLDAEKGYGINFSKQHHVSGYPSYLYFAPNGDLLVSALGQQDADGFLNISRRALNNWKQGISLQEMERQLSANRENPEFVIQYIQELGGHGRPNGILLEYYLNAIHKDSLYTPGTIKMVSRSMSGQMQLDGKVFEVLRYAYSQRPIHSGALMGPWQVINNALLTVLDSATVYRDEEGFQKVLEAVGRLYAKPEMAEQFKAYYGMRYYALSGDESQFKDSFASFVYRFVLDANEEAVFQSDFSDYENALLLEYGSKDPVVVGDAHLERTQRSHYSFVRLALDQLLDAIRLYDRYFEPSAEQINEVIVPSLSRAIRMYIDNPVYVNDYLVTQYQSALERLKR